MKLEALFFFKIWAETCSFSDLLEGLLEAALLRHRQGAHRVPAVAELLNLHLDPRRVIAAGVHEIPGGSLQCLHAARPLPQVLLEGLQVQTNTRVRF